MNFNPFHSFIEDLTDEELIERVKNNKKHIDKILREME